MSGLGSAHRDDGEHDSRACSERVMSGRLDGPAKPHPKAASTKAGRQRRYRRIVASPKGWQAIVAAKIGPCRVCCDPASNGARFSKIQLHHVVSREDHGDDVPDNLVPLCPECHDRVTRRAWLECRELLEMLTDSEYAYMIQRGGENYPERAYGIVYDREGVQGRSTGLGA